MILHRIHRENAICLFMEQLKEINSNNFSPWFCKIGFTKQLYLFPKKNKLKKGNELAWKKKEK